MIFAMIVVSASMMESVPSQRIRDAMIASHAPLLPTVSAMTLRQEAVPIAVIAILLPTIFATMTKTTAALTVLDATPSQMVSVSPLKTMLVPIVSPHATVMASVSQMRTKTAVIVVLVLLLPTAFATTLRIVTVPIVSLVPLLPTVSASRLRMKLVLIASPHVTMMNSAIQTKTKTAMIVLPVTMMASAKPLRISNAVTVLHAIRMVSARTLSKTFAALTAILALLLPTVSANPLRTKLVQTASQDATMMDSARTLKTKLALIVILVLLLPTVSVKSLKTETVLTVSSATTMISVSPLRALNVALTAWIASQTDAAKRLRILTAPIVILATTTMSARPLRISHALTVILALLLLTASVRPSSSS